MRRLSKKEETEFFKTGNQILLEMIKGGDIGSYNYDARSKKTNTCLEHLFSLSKVKRNKFLRSKCWKKVPSNISYYYRKETNNIKNIDDFNNVSKANIYKFYNYIATSIATFSQVSKDFAKFIIKNCDGVLLLDLLKNDYIVKDISKRQYDNLFKTHDDRVFCHLIKTAPESCVKKQMKIYKGKNKRIISLFRERTSSNYMHEHMLEVAKKYLSEGNSWRANHFIVNNKFIDNATQEEILSLIDSHNTDVSRSHRRNFPAITFLSCLEKENVYTRLSYFKKLCPESLALYLDFSAKV